jgi:hypothetical protein
MIRLGSSFYKLLLFLCCVNCRVLNLVAYMSFLPDGGVIGVRQSGNHSIIIRIDEQSDRDWRRSMISWLLGRRRTISGWVLTPLWAEESWSTLFDPMDVSDLSDSIQIGRHLEVYGEAYPACSPRGSGCIYDLVVVLNSDQFQLIPNVKYALGIVFEDGVVHHMLDKIFVLTHGGQARVDQVIHQDPLDDMRFFESFGSGDLGCERLVGTDCVSYAANRAEFFSLWRQFVPKLGSKTRRIIEDNQPLRQTRPRFFNDAELDEICAICTEVVGHDATQTPCPRLTHTPRGVLRGHYFHPECIKKWMEHKLECPTCRHNL